MLMCVARCLHVHYLVFSLIYVIDNNIIKHALKKPHTFPSASKNSILVYLINARSLVNKMSLLRAYIFEFKPSLVCVTESWPNSDDSFILCLALRFSVVTGLVLVMEAVSYYSFATSTHPHYITLISSTVTCKVILSSSDCLLMYCASMLPKIYLLDNPVFSYLNLW